MSPRQSRSAPSKRGPRGQGHFLAWSVFLVAVLAIGWFAWVHHEILSTAAIDNAEAADAIAVFGAAEYAGRPSPVFRARLDKAVSLYQRKIAPEIVTLGGGADKDSGKTEGGVGRDYLLANGVPLADIVAETNSFDTEQQVQRLAEIARQRGFHHIVVVSDGTHLFRIALLCRRAGLDVYTSPRPMLGHLDEVDTAERLGHEMLSYTSLALNLHFSWLHRWLEGKNT